MKKLFVLLLCLLTLLGLTACGDDTVDPDLVITRAPIEETTAEIPAQSDAPAVQHRDADYRFVADGVELVPGAAFDPGVLPAAESVYQVPSCAIEGTDNLYHYGTFELTAFHDGTGEVIYSIVLLDPNTATPEGLTLGSDVAQVTALYGEGYTREGTAFVYTGGDTMLYILLQGDQVAGIEYRMIVK